MAQVSEITAQIKSFALEAGFDVAGIAPVRDFPELEHFPAWVAAGHAGEMKYLEARDEFGKLKRSSLQTVAPWAHSVIVCAINYNTAQPYSTQFDDPGRGWISRYAWGREDYHESVMRRLKAIETKLLEKRLKSKPAATWTQGRWLNVYMQSTPAWDGWARTPASLIRTRAHGYFWG